MRGMVVLCGLFLMGLSDDGIRQTELEGYQAEVDGNTITSREGF